MENIYNEKFAVYEYGKGFSKENFIRDRVKYPQDKEEHDDGFVVFDLGDVIAKHNQWCKLLPRVQPFYAVKCRPYMVILKVMVAMGLSFDCASKQEMDSILQLGVNPSQLIYSHTRKQPSTLAYANEKGIDLMTFDDEFELAKIKRVFPLARLLLRYAIDDPSASDFAPGIKFGCRQESVTSLLKLAKQLDLNCVGVHFHVGTGNTNPGLFTKAIAFSRQVFNIAEDLGFEFSILDLGGGFPGEELSTGLFKEYAEVVNSALDEYFPDASKVEIIAEPGTYYMRSAGTVVAGIIGKRMRRVEKKEYHISDQDSVHYDYYLNDNVYTSLRDVIYAPNSYLPIPLNMLKEKSNKSSEFTGILYGDTCCGTDVIVENCHLPELDEGDWVYFEDKGDYSHTTTNFNGFKRPFCYYALPENCKSLRNSIDEEQGKNGAMFLIPEDSYHLTRNGSCD